MQARSGRPAHCRSKQENFGKHNAYANTCTPIVCTGSHIQRHALHRFRWTPQKMDGNVKILLAHCLLHCVKPWNIDIVNCVMAVTSFYHFWPSWILFEYFRIIKLAPLSLLDQIASKWSFMLARSWSENAYKPQKYRAPKILLSTTYFQKHFLTSF